MPTHSPRYELLILTHGRRYTEEYDTLDEATEAALLLTHEPRERAEQITLNGQVCLDRAQIEELARERDET